jgi:hypothetical protein
MLARSPSAGAVRASRSRARRRDGLVIMRVEVHRRRLIAAMGRANPARAGELETTAEVEAELQAIVDAFVTRWLGQK